MSFSSLHAEAAAIGSALPLTRPMVYAPAFSLPGVHAHHTSVITWSARASQIRVTWCSRSSQFSSFKSELQLYICVSGPVSPFVSAGIDVLFNSRDALQNIFFRRVHFFKFLSAKSFGDATFAI
ncbi:hypothetical protein DFH09DRAFT_1097851 [Mycena vulgaris]|nr:hypothetical protein DFH09DRAFT_1097851 [Mycena vulgaris]